MEGGPPGFPRDSSCPAVLWILLCSHQFHLRVSHTLWMAFPHHSVISLSHNCSPQPRTTEVFRFGLFRVRSPLLTESRLISLPEATEMFQFTSSLHLKLWIHFKLNTRLTYPGFPIRKSADRSVCATPRSLSQLVTSFIDDRCQGIRPALLVT